MAGPSHKKRSAASSKDLGPPSKKAAVSEKSKSKPRSVPSSQRPVEKQKKRSRPITAPVVNDDSATDADEDAEDAEEEQMDRGDDLEGDEDAMDVEPAERAAKDPNAIRESRKAQRDLQAQRRAAKPHSNLVADAKRVWSQARQLNITKEERNKYVKELMGIVRGKVQDICFKHDSSRIIQTLVKWGGQKERDEIAAELKGRFKELAQSKYAKFLATKLIRYCSSTRASILLEFRTHVLRLLLHREASSVIADAFELYANAAERNILLRDFYGKEALLFDSSGDAKAQAGGLDTLLKSADPERRKRVLGALKDNLLSIFNNPDKGAVSLGIVHRALWEYLTEVNKLEDGVEREKARREIFENCQELTAEMVHTKDGSRVVRDFFAHGTAKDRKQLIKTLKPHIEKICKDDEAQTVLFTALDVVDDTKLLSKSVVPEIVAHASDMSFTSHKAGRRALLYLLVPRCPRHFTPASLKTLAEADPVRAQTSKKDPEVRAQEVRAAASEGLLRSVAEKGEEMIGDPGASLLVGEIMLFAEGDKSDAIATLLRPISTPYVYPPPETSTHVIDAAHTARLYKTLIQGGHYDRTAKEVAPSAHFSPSTFASAFMRAAGRDNLVSMTKGNGTFVVVELIERIKADGTPEEMKELRSWFGGDVRKEIESGEARGKEALLQKLKDLE
ncbi:hypothetical protein BOTBODRAFT_30530 [Botryobasidium botryosum FD-172 SS1]|uniref:PUM-HD domain-containing protein n=1 Tax=Botryobasidium botryosum (strain FD-172 SS1) TaxID=930990 RepID=A0A067MLG8_BOTB1|nr:hypothetical protein BOTBODRAFT_30530 [Botryobasidium botryosum FD-172 SS1]